MIHHVIVDRDGVLNQEVPGGYVLAPEDWVWEARSLEALAILAEQRVRVSVVTNQSCIGRGLTTPDNVERIHRGMLEQAQAAGGKIDAVFTCPHRPDAGCACR